MATGSYNDFDEVMYRGDTKYLTATITKSGSPVNPTGGSLWFTAKQNLVDLDTDAIVRLSTDLGGITILNAASGIIQIRIPQTATANLPGQTVLFCDLQILDAAGDMQTLAAGKLTVYPDVTRATS